MGMAASTPTQVKQRRTSRCSGPAGRGGFLVVSARHAPPAAEVVRYAAGKAEAALSEATGRHAARRNHGTCVPGRTRRAIDRHAILTLQTTARNRDPVVASGRRRGVGVGGAADGLPVACLDGGNGTGV